MSTNTKISNLVSSQMPGFVRDDHEMFITFMKAYYEWMEQNGGTVDVIKNISDYKDVDKSVDVFLDELQKTFISAIPKEVIVDKNLLLKHIKDFYRSRGTEKSVEFLLRILFGQDAGNTSFYYPKADILRASDGKWFIEKSLKVTDIYIDGNPINDDATIKTAFKSTKIQGNTSGATAIVEHVDVYYDGATLVREVKISNQTKDFTSGETIFTLFDDGNGTHTLSANTFSGIINKVMLLNAGTGYIAGTNIPLESNTGNGGIIQISSVTPGNVKSVYVIDGGAGYQVNNYLLFSGGGGFGANAIVTIVQKDGFYHPNSYNIESSTISLEAHTQIGNNKYSNLNSAITDPANNWIANSMSFFVYGNTGPASFITMTQSGNNYITPPTATIVANTRVRELGILGKMKIVSGGKNYVKGDIISFNNVIGGYGTGAAANVTNVDANGTITEVHFRPVTGFITGGSGYDMNYLPTTSIVSANGNGANIIVTSLLGYGANLLSVSDKLGAIQSLTIIAGGSSYNTPPTLNLQSLGDGTAQANVTIVTGAYVYPGRYLNDDGQLSAYNFLQDRDYYQTFSYVVKLTRSINDYRKYLKDLIHPAGMKLFGEYLDKDDYLTTNTIFKSVNTSNSIIVYGTYNSKANANGSTIEVTTQRNVSTITIASVEFVDGNAAGNLSNGIFSVSANGTNSYIFIQSNNKVNGTGNVYTSI